MINATELDLTHHQQLKFSIADGFWWMNKKLISAMKPIRMKMSCAVRRPLSLALFQLKPVVARQI
jgi:hypothetical protein